MDDARPITPETIMQLGWGFWGSKTLLTAVELGVFTELGKGPLELEALTTRLALHPRSARDFFDALVALGVLARDGGVYANTPETALFLDRSRPSYIGGILEMANKRLYRFWDGLTEALRTGQPQNEAKDGGEDLFGVIYADPVILESFLRGMTGVSLPAAQAMAALFPWNEVKSFVDVGCAQGGATVAIAQAHPHGGDRLRSGRRSAGVRGLCEGKGTVGAGALCGGRLLRRPAPVRRRDHHGPHPARLGS